jgi:hypothetical protein
MRIGTPLNVAPQKVTEFLDITGFASAILKIAKILQVAHTLVVGRYCSVHKHVEILQVAHTLVVS